MGEEIEIFISYAHEDELLRQQLEKRLRALKREGMINVWHDREIRAGTEWEREIDIHLNTAKVVLLLVSPDFIDSDYCYSIEMKRAMERHELGKTCVIPIILRPVYWQKTPFGKLQALPTEAKPVTSRYWHDLDEAFLDVEIGIRNAIEELINVNNSSKGDLAGLQYKKISNVDQELMRLLTTLISNILTTNSRGVSLMKAIESTGLIDLEDRNDMGRRFPPEQLYEMAKHQIVITGVSTYRTFDQDIDSLHKILKAGKRLYVLILHPDAEDVEIWSKIEDRDIRFEIMYVVSIAERLKQQYPDFQIRFMNELPPFTGVMIDGDIEQEELGDREAERELLDQEGQIRIQPHAAYRTRHQGLVLQFKKVVGTFTSPFDYFAQDMRQQWQYGERLEKVLGDIDLLRS